jgi:hypothetical protein
MEKGWRVNHQLNEPQKHIATEGENIIRAKEKRRTVIG